MRRRRFEPLERDLSVLVLGTAVFERADYEESTPLLDAWLEYGGNAIDTGRQYGNAERIVGRWLRERGVEDEVVVITKAGHHDEQTLEPRLTAEDLAFDIEGSLDELGLARLELLLLHRDDPRRSVPEILDDLATLAAGGTVRLFGASNWTTQRLQEARDYASAQPVPAFACSSPNLSLALANEPPWPGCISIDRGPDQAWYAETQLPVFAWQALAGGFFSGVADQEVERVYGGGPNLERRGRARELARERGATPMQVALAWTLAQPYPVYAIIGPRTPEELRASIDAVDLDLSAAEVEWLDHGDSGAA
jgi:aryl-alcohol dehydrogenase-like predicted oxidoreductase